MAINRRDKEDMDRWHRMQGETPIPKKRGGPPEGTQNRLIHGIFASKCLNTDEKIIFDNIIEQLHKDFQFNRSSDFLQVELVGVYSVKLMRAQIEGNVAAAESLDRMIRCHLKDLKTTKISREGEEPKGAKSSPAEWAANLLGKIGGEATKKSPSGKKPKKIADNTAEDKSDDADDTPDAEPEDE